jgi:hypothetical protein
MNNVVVRPDDESSVDGSYQFGFKQKSARDAERRYLPSGSQTDSEPSIGDDTVVLAVFADKLDNCEDQGIAGIRNGKWNDIHGIGSGVWSYGIEVVE